LSRVWLSGVTNIDRIDEQFDSQQRGHVGLSTAVLDQTISRCFATWSSIEVDGSEMSWARCRDIEQSSQTLKASYNGSGVYRT